MRPTAPLKEPRGGSVQYWGVGVEFSYNSIIDNGRIVLLWRVS